MVAVGDFVVNREGKHVVSQVGEDWFDLLDLATGMLMRSFHSDNPLDGVKHIPQKS